MTEPNSEQTKPDKCCMTCTFHRNDRRNDYCIEHGAVIIEHPSEVSLWEIYCDEYKVKEEEEEEEVYNYMCKMIPDAMGVLDEAIKKGMPKYYLVDMIVKKRLPKNIQDKVMMAINWRYKKLQAAGL